MKGADWLKGPDQFFSPFFQWTSARVNANQGRCINGHLSHCMRRGLNVMLNCLSCAPGWSLHYMALGGLLQDLGDPFRLIMRTVKKQRRGVYWSGIRGKWDGRDDIKPRGLLKSHAPFFFYICVLLILPFKTPEDIIRLLSLFLSVCDTLFPVLWLSTSCVKWGHNLCVRVAPPILMSTRFCPPSVQNQAPEANALIHEVEWTRLFGLADVQNAGGGGSDRIIFTSAAS